MKKSQLLELVAENGTPLFVIDHEEIRKEYGRFKKKLPHVQAYYAVKANPEDTIIETLFKEGASFDVASFPEFMKVHRLIEHLGEKERFNFIYDKIIFSNTIKDNETLQKLKPYKPLVTYDNPDEVEKIKKHCDTAGLVLRVKVPDTGSQVEFGSKFGVAPSEAMELINFAFKRGLNVEGLSFHVGSQCQNFDNYIDALGILHEVCGEGGKRGYNLRIIDIGGGFPAAYYQQDSFDKLAGIINSETERLFGREKIAEKEIELLAEPGRFLVANSSVLVSEIIGRQRRDGKRFYHINDSVYHTFSGVVFDHQKYHFKSFKPGKIEECAVVGRTCDSFDKISLSEMLPGNLKVGDLLYTENIGAYSIASSSSFNGFSSAKVVNVNF